MRHVFDAVLHPSTGAALEGVLVRVFDADDALVDIYADENATPIETVSGETNAAKTDADGMFSYYVEGGIYTERFYQGDTVLKTIRNVDRGVDVRRIELADTTGAALVGTSDGSTVQAGLDARPELDAVAFTDASLPNPVVLRTIMLDAQVSRMLAGAGDGSTEAADVTAETAKFQAIIDQGRSFSVPEPSVSYNVNTLTLVNGQTIEGCGQFREDNSYQFVGNGVDPVFQLGNATLSGPRMHCLRDLSVFNSGAGCISAQSAPNIVIERVRARSESLATGATLNGNESFRAAIRNSNITCSGGGTAISWINAANGLTLENCTSSGGSGGRAMRFGFSAGLRIVSNIIESSLDGIWVGSTADTGDGNCNGVLIAANYFEQCKTPLVLAKHFSIFGLECISNFISNSATSTVPTREACIQFGRIQGGLIADNSLIPHSTEDLFWIWLENASGGFNKLTVDRNYVSGTPAATHTFKGTYAANASVKGAVGAVCNFGFMGSGNPLGSDHVGEWISPLIDSSATYGPFAWLTDGLINMGGKVISAEVIDHDGGADGSVQIKIGRTGSVAETVNLADMNSLTFADGRALLPLGLANIYDGQSNIYQVVTAGGATAKFRLRIRYRAN